MCNLIEYFVLFCFCRHILHNHCALLVSLIYLLDFSLVNFAAGWLLLLYDSGGWSSGGASIFNLHSDDGMNQFWIKFKLNMLMTKRLLRLSWWMKLKLHPFDSFSLLYRFTWFEKVKVGWEFRWESASNDTVAPQALEVVCLFWNSKVF